MSYCSEFFKGIASYVKEPSGYSYYLKDGKLIYVDGYENILLLSPDTIVLKAKRTKIEIQGTSLQIERIDGQSMVISGKIDIVKTESGSKNEQ